MSDLAISWSVAGATIAFLVLSGWRNHRVGYRRRAVAELAQPLPGPKFTPPPKPVHSVASQLARFNASLQAESIAQLARHGSVD